MSFKRVQPRPKTKPESQDEPAIPGAIPTELLNTVEAEVSRENAPLLEFLVRNARWIGLAVVVLVVVLAGYGGYRWWDGKQRTEALAQLGGAVVSSSPNQLESVLAIAEQAPAGVQTAAYFEAARIAYEQNNLSAAADAWAKVAEAGDGLGFAASLNRAQLLQVTGKAEEAARLYTSLLPDLQGGIKDAVTSYAAAAWAQAAQSADNAAARSEAVRLYTELLNSPTMREKDFVRYSLARLGEAQ